MTDPKSAQPLNHAPSCPAHDGGGCDCPKSRQPAQPSRECITHHRACDCREAAHAREVESLTADCDRLYRAYADALGAQQAAEEKLAQFDAYGIAVASALGDRDRVERMEDLLRIALERFDRRDIEYVCARHFAPSCPSCLAYVMGDIRAALSADGADRKATSPADFLLRPRP